MPPETSVIIRDTKEDIMQARLEADELLCQFIDRYVDTATHIREEAIKRFRERLKDLPARSRATVCDTLANDDKVCCNMYFGDGAISHGGMAFSYKVQSDKAFNALSHHLWKDLTSLTGDTNDSTDGFAKPVSGREGEKGRSDISDSPGDDDAGYQDVQVGVNDHDGGCSDRVSPVARPPGWQVQAEPEETIVAGGP